MTSSGSETRKRQITLKARFNDAEAAIVKARADAAGVPVAALIRSAALSMTPPRKSRTPPLDRKAAAQLLGQIGDLASALRDASGAADPAASGAVIEAAHRDLTEMRALLFLALGRRP